VQGVEITALYPFLKDTRDFANGKTVLVLIAASSQKDSE
jgi:hypothetical protein